MSDEPTEAAALARAFARHLEHLREFRGVHYVGAAPMPRAAMSETHDCAESEPEPEPEPEPESEPESATPEPRATVAVEASQPPASLRDAAREVVRTRAEQWPAAKKLQYLRERNVGDCRRCPLAESRSHIVFGVGSPEADLMFIGEAPGAEEDRRGEPFVGAAGQRLDRWLEQLGLARERVYIANVLKCRPPGNRDPRPLEIERCSPFLHAQIRAIEPKVIVALGRFAGCLLLGSDRRMYQMRGAVHRYLEPKSGAEIPLVVTYHPSYVLRSEKQPRDAQAARGKTDRGGAIKSEDEKVLEDLGRAVALMRDGG